VLGLVQGRPIPVACSGVEAGTAIPALLSSCSVTARVTPDLQRQLRLPSDVLSLSGRPFRPPTSTPEAVDVVIPPAIATALAGLRRVVTVQFDVRVFDQVGRGSTPLTQDVILSGRAGPRDCPAAPAGVTCSAGLGQRNAGGPAVTGLRWDVTADAGATLLGTYLDDALLGRHGSDTLTGGDGDDLLRGDAATRPGPATQRDRLVGDAGDDWIHAGPGTSTIAGGAGNDRIFAVTGRGTIDRGPGRDTVRLAKQQRLKPTRRQRKAGRKGTLRPDAYRLKGCEKVTRG